MKKLELAENTAACISVTHDALQLVWDNVNKGQKKKLYKQPEIKAVLDRYGVEVDV